MRHQLFTIRSIIRKACSITWLAVPFTLFLLLSGCAGRSGRFKMEGRLLHLNQGQLLVYSPDGGISGLDTITIQAGRFVYETEMHDPSTLVIVFPNFSEQPVFAESGGKVTIKGDASHLREMEVEGSDDNELMTDFRQLLAKNSPLDAPKLTADFVKEHPESRVGAYLVNTYLVKSDQPDYATAIKLVKLMRKEQTRNGQLVLLERQLSQFGSVRVGQPLPHFKAVTLDGRTVTQQDFAHRDGIVLVWASWCYESLGSLRTLQEAKKKKPDLQVLTICLDANRKECEKTLRLDNITLPTVCDGRMLDCPLLSRLSLSDVPDNIVLAAGRVKKRSVSATELRDRFVGIH